MYLTIYVYWTRPFINWEFVALQGASMGVRTWIDERPLNLVFNPGSTTYLLHVIVQVT